MPSPSLLLEQPIRMASILESSKTSFFPALTKIIATLGETSSSVGVLSASLRAGMSVARFDFSHGDIAYHQAALDNLKQAMESTNKLCAVMLDTVGPELQVVNKGDKEILLEADATVVLTPDQDKEASASLLPINFHGLAQSVKPGDKIYIGQYLFTGSETTSVWLEVSELRGEDVVCLIKSSASLKGSLLTLHVSLIRLDLPTLSDHDKDVISRWGVDNKIDFLSLSYTRHADDVRHARDFLSEVGLDQTQIIAKIDNIEGVIHFDEILKAADGILLSRGNLGMDLPAEKVFLFQKAAIYRCNMAGKPAIVTRVVDTMTDNLRPTRAEATDVANAVLDGCDAILLGAETQRGSYPVEAISMVCKICAEAEKVYNQARYFKKAVKYVTDPVTHMESLAISAVQTAIKVNAAIIIVFTSTGRAARLTAKYRPTMPVLNVVIPRVKSNSIKWTLTGVSETRQSLLVRGLFPFLAGLTSATMNVSLAPQAPQLSYSGEGGSYSSWSPNDLPMLRLASIGAAKLNLRSGGFAAPSYSDSSKVAYVLQGTGICGLTVPEAAKEKVIPIKEGDALAIPFGHVTWWFNPNESNLTILFLGDTSKGHQPGQFTNFCLTGPTGIFTGFTTEFVSRAWDLSESDVTKLVHNQSSSGIVKLRAGQKMPEALEANRDGLVVNCLEAPLDVDIKGGGCVVVLNSKNLPTVEMVGLGADLVRLNGGAMCSPGFSCDSAYQVTYIVKGSGRVQVVGIDGKRVLETKVSGGQLFIVPRFFVVSKIADPEGMEWFSIITTPNPVFSHLAGRTSVWKAVSSEVLEAAFDTTPELEQRFRSTRTSDEIFFPPK